MRSRLWVFALLLLVLSCTKNVQNVQDNPVPSVPVNLTIYPNDPFHFRLQSIGGWMYIQGGVRGIIVYRKSNEEFLAIERASSAAPNNDMAVVIVAADNFTVRDTITGSEWRLFDGGLTKGPGTWPLRLYGTVFDGNALRIRN